MLTSLEKFITASDLLATTKDKHSVYILDQDKISRRDVGLFIEDIVEPRLEKMLLDRGELGSEENQPWELYGRTNNLKDIILEDGVETYVKIDPTCNGKFSGMVVLTPGTSIHFGNILGMYVCWNESGSFRQFLNAIIKSINYLNYDYLAISRYVSPRVYCVKYHKIKM